MDFKVTSFKNDQRRRQGFSLPELMVTLCIGGLVLGATVAFSLYVTNGFAAVSNWMELDQANRLAIDTMARDIRQVNRMTAYQTNAVTFEDGDGASLTFTYNPAKKTLTRTKGTSTTVLLRECDEITFSMMQRNIIEGSYTYYPAEDFDTCKVVGISWTCSRTILGRKSQLSGGQTTQVVIRKL